jgi:teichoic acid transport system permease protein
MDRDRFDGPARRDRQMMTSLLSEDSPAPLAPELQQLGVRPPLKAYLHALWARRDFIVALPVGQLRSRNANTVLGNLWHLLNPLILAATYFLIFGVFFNARDDVDNYIGFLVTGLFVFHYTSKSLTGGANTIVANEGIIRNVNMPRAAFPVGSVLAETLAHLPAMALLLVLVTVTGESPDVAWVLVVPLIALQALFNLGLSLWIGRLTFHFRDVKNVLPFLTRLLLYMSGVFFTIDRVPAGVLQTVFEFNPLQVFINLNRLALLDGTTSAGTWLAAALWTMTSLVSGLLFFWSRENSYGRD